MLDDMRDYRADSFQLMSPDAAVLALCCIIALAAIFTPYL